MAYDSLRKLWKLMTPASGTASCTYGEKDIPSLNSSNVVNVLCKVKAETRWSYTAMWILQIPTSKLNEMGRAPGCNEEKLLQAVSLWLKSCPYASWRWLIWYLDEYGENELVDEISGYAEPLRESNLTTECLSNISKHIGSYDLEKVLRISRRKIDVQGLVGKDIHKNKEKMISLWLKTSPYATFETLVGQLFKCSAAAGDALKVLQDHWKKEHTPDPTLTVKNLVAVTKGCAIHELGHQLNIYVPYSSEWRKEILFQSFLDNYPIPTWDVIIHAVYELSWKSDQWNCSTELITKRYLRIIQGTNLQQMCMEAISKYVSCPEDMKLLPIPERLKSRINDIVFWNIY